MSRVDLKGMFERLIEHYKETTRIRFFTNLVALGVTLVGATWVNIVLRISEKYFGIPVEDMDNLGTYIGIVLMYKSRNSPTLRVPGGWFQAAAGND
jgi:hypothetical protein